MKKLLDIISVNIKKRFSRGNKEKPTKDTILTMKDNKIKRIFFEDGVMIGEEEASKEK